MKEVLNLQKQLTPEQAMGRNRKARRKLGKLNGFKIPGSTVPITKTKEQE